jgi:hypothetical protein
MTEEEIVRDLISNKARDDRIKEIFMSEKCTSFEDARNMAKIQEKIEFTKESRMNVDAIQRDTYANVTNRRRQYGNDKRQQGTQQTFREQIPDTRYVPNNKNAQYVPIANEQRGENVRDKSHNTFQEGQRRTPTISLKDIARRLFNESRSINTPKPENLTPGQCFCCGEKGHRRFECPMKDKCLICGKEGHAFRNCFLLKNSNSYKKRIACVYEENYGENCEEMNEDAYSSYEEQIQKSMETKKNKDDPIGYISSVGSRQ